MALGQLLHASKDLPGFTFDCCSHRLVCQQTLAAHEGRKDFSDGRQLQTGGEKKLNRLHPFHGFFAIVTIPVLSLVTVKDAPLLVVPYGSGADGCPGCQFSNEHLPSVPDIDTRVKAYF